MYRFLFWVILFLPSFAFGDQVFLREYATATTVDVCLPDYAESREFNTSITFSAGDVQVMKDEGAPANIGTLPTDEGDCYSIPLTGAEMTAARVTVTFIDSATKTWMDTSIYIDTYGDASSQHPDIGTAGGTTSLEGLILISTTVTGLSSQTVFNLTAGSADDDAYNGMTLVIVDAATAEQIAVSKVLDYTGSTKTVTLSFDPGIFTIANSDKVYILAEKW